MKERRFFKGGNVRAATGDKPGISGYAAVFNEQYDSGFFIETIKPGAFTRAIREKQDVRALFNHDPSNLLGRTDARTLSLMQDASGLHFDCDLPDTQIGRDVRSLVDRGDLTGCSFAFSVTKQTWREETNSAGDMELYRDIEDVNLYDVGPVTFPAYEATSVDLARSLFPEGIPAEVRSHVPALAKEELQPAPTPTPEEAEKRELAEMKTKVEELQERLEAIEAFRTQLEAPKPAPVKSEQDVGITVDQAQAYTKTLKASLSL